jgi:hypothetical protein
MENHGQRISSTTLMPCVVTLARSAAAVLETPPSPLLPLPLDRKAWFPTLTLIRARDVRISPTRFFHALFCEAMRGRPSARLSSGTWPSAPPDRRHDRKDQTVRPGDLERQS